MTTISYLNHLSNAKGETMEIIKLGWKQYQIQKRLPNGDLFKLHFIAYTKKEAMSFFRTEYKERVQKCKSKKGIQKKVSS